MCLVEARRQSARSHEIEDWRPSTARKQDVYADSPVGIPCVFVAITVTTLQDYTGDATVTGTALALYPMRTSPAFAQTNCLTAPRLIVHGTS